MIATLTPANHFFQTRHQIGDVQVLSKQGQPVVLFQQIANPQNIKNLIQTEMKVIGKWSQTSNLKYSFVIKRKKITGNDLVAIG